MTSSKQKYRLGFFIYLIILVTCRPLLAQDTDETEITVLTGNICDLLLTGHSIDEVIKQLDNGQYPYDMQKLVTHIYEILGKQYSKNETIKIVTSHKKATQFYVRQSLWAIIKGVYYTSYVVKIVFYLTLIVAICLICFFLYKYSKEILERIKKILSLLGWLTGFFKKSKVSDYSPESIQSPHPESDQQVANQNDINQDIIQQVAEVPADTQDQQLSCCKSEPQNNVYVPLEIKKEQDLHVSQQNTQKAYQQNQDQAVVSVRRTNPINSGLSDRVAQQSVYAKNIGLEPAIIEFVDVKVPATIGPRKKFGELIAEQIEYAKSIGLVPTEVPASELKNESH